MAHVLALHDSQEGRQGSLLLAAGAQRARWAARDPTDSGHLGSGVLAVAGPMIYPSL